MTGAPTSARKNRPMRKSTSWHKVFKTFSEVTGCKMKSDKQVAKWLKDPYSDSAEYIRCGATAWLCVWFVLCGVVWYAQSGGDNAPI